MGSSRLARALLLGAAGALLLGHSPYRQWYVFRAKHLVVVTSDGLPGAFALAEAVAGAIAARLPETKALPATARASAEVVRLLRSRQLQVGLIPPADALEALQGKGRFSDDAPVPLRALASLGSYLLVVLDEYPRDKAFRIVRTVAEYPGSWPLPQKPVLRGQAPIPFHPGALDYYEGRPAPSGG